MPIKILEKTKTLKISDISHVDLGHADIHIHSNYSDGQPSVGQILDYVQKETDLNVIAICDHNTIEGAKEAEKLIKQKKYRFEAVIGQEISTRQGHILGLFLKEKIRSDLSTRETLKEIKKQGGIAIAPHPFYHTRMKDKNIIMDGVGFVTLIRDIGLIAGIEVINGTPTLKKENLRARFLNDALLFKAEVGGSDAHILKAIGMAYTLFEGKTADDLRNALEFGQTRAMMNRWGFMALMRYLFFFLPRGLRIMVYTLLHGRRKKRPQISGVK